MVLICDYQTGFIPPEMVKKRRVVVVSPKHINNRGLCVVVPISTSPPDSELPTHVRFEAGNYRFLSNSTACWAKCAILASVSYRRLDRVRVGSNFIAPRLSHEDFNRICDAVAHVIGRY